MSLSARSRALRSGGREGPKRRGISLGRGLEASVSWAEDTSRTAASSGPRQPVPPSPGGPTGPDGRPFADAQTLRDLDVFPHGSDSPSLYSLLDRTRTSGGRHALLALLSSGQVDLETIERRQAAIGFFADAAARERWALRSSDRAVTHLERYLDSYVHPLTGMRGPLYWIRAFWFRASYANYFEYLDSCIRTLHRFVRSLDESRSARAGELPDELLACRVAIDELLDDETVRSFLRAGGRYSRFRPPAMLDFDERFRRRLAPLLREALRAIHQIDLYLSLGQVTDELGLTFPRVATGPERETRLECRGLVHPFLAEPVANDLALDPEHGFLFLTGPNMAGKTTLMKAMGLAVYMAHVGLPVPCRDMTVTRLDGILSSLNVEDNLGKGVSFFYAEVRRVRDVAEALNQGRRLLVLFDELFKGTNLKDALDGSRLVVRGFRRFPGSLFVLSSHLLELGEELAAERTERGETHGEAVPGPGAKDHERGALRPSPLIPIQFLRFDAEVVEGRARFPFVLREGLSTERLGMLILEGEGIPELLRRDGQGSPGAEPLPR